MGRRILIVSASMGAGHDAVAAELARRLEARGDRVARVDLLDLLPAGAGRALRTGYRTAIRRCPWAYETVYSAFFRHPADPRVRTSRKASTGPLIAILEPRLRDVIARLRPDAVVSTFHQAAQVTGRLRSRGDAVCPPSTVLITDFAVHRQWLHPGNDLHLCPTEAAAATARAATGGRAYACGPLVPPAFATAGDGPGAGRRRQEFALRGPGRPPVLLSAGAWGVGPGLTTTATLLARAGHLPVLLCGRDERLRRAAAALPGVLALGWTEDLPDVMGAAHALVDNAAGQTAVQALAAGVPVIGHRPIAGHGAEGVREMAAAGLTEEATDETTLLASLERLVRPGPCRERRIAAGRSAFTADAAALIAG